MVVRLNSFLRKDVEAFEHRGLGRVGRIAYINFSPIALVDIFQAFLSIWNKFSPPPHL